MAKQIDLNEWVNSVIITEGDKRYVKKESGKTLSTNDYTTTEKNKLAGIENGATKTIIDSSLSTSSTNPVENKVINTALNSKATSNDIDTKISTHNSNSSAHNDIRQAIAGLSGDVSDLSSLSSVKVVSSKPNASADTTDKIYIVVNGDTADAYYTVQSGSTYSWKKLDDDIINEVSINWSEVQNKPTTFTPSSHTHTKSQITDFPTIPNGSSTATDIKMNGTQSAGSASTYAKADHVHPVDTSRAAASHTHSKSQISDFPTLSTVATSGSYDDLTNKPTIPSSITVDSSLSSTSTNPVQNKVINTALSGKASTSTATTSANGLMSSTDKSKLDGIATGANKITVDSSLSSSSTNPVQNKVINTALSGKAASTHNHTKSQITDFPSLSTVATSGSYNDLSDKPNIPDSVVVDTSLSSTSTNPLQNKAINAALSGKAPTSHASTSTTYGAASTSNYGHAKLYNGVDSTSTSLAATAGAVKTAYDLANGKPSLGTTSTTAAAGNHNHDGVYLKTHQSLDSKTVTVEKQTKAESGYVATYIVKQNGTQVGSKINIPKDFLVKSASVGTCSTTGTPTGFTQGDKYIDFVVNTKDNTGTDEHIYLNVNDLVDAYTAGAGLTLTSGNQFKHSNSVTALTTASFKKIKYDSEGHITGTEDVDASDLPTHYHSQYLSSHNPIDSSLSTTSTNAVQNKVITSALAGKAASDHNHDGTYLKSYTPPTASTSQAGIVQLSSAVDSTSETIGATSKAVKLAYENLPSHNHDTEYQPIGDYLTEHQDISGKIDTAGTGLSKNGTTLNHSNSITAQTTSKIYPIKIDAQGHITATGTGRSTTTSVTSGSASLVTSGAVYSALSDKADKSHASSGTTYGLGTISVYGHCKTINTLTQSSHISGCALSAYQGYVLKGLVDDKENQSNKVSSWSATTTDTNYPSEKLVKDSLDAKLSTATYEDGVLTIQ